jgi:Na+/proline symporter
MCHAMHVKLSAEERASARRLAGFLVPIYATAILAIITLAAVNSGPPAGELVASASAPAAATAK